MFNMDLFFYVIITIVLAIHLWVWTSVVRLFGYLFLPTLSEYDKSLKFRHLIMSMLYDIFIDLKTWKSSSRKKAIERRARNYGYSED